MLTVTTIRKVCCEVSLLPLVNNFSRLWNFVVVVSNILITRIIIFSFICFYTYYGLGLSPVRYIFRKC